MDKLKPFIRNHFWILAGLVVPLVLYGYYSANGALKAATEEREKTLTEVKNGVSSGREPNEDYIRKLEHINTFLEASVQDATVDLWRKQQERMTWPQAVASRIPSEFMADFDQQVPFIYKGLYPELIRRLQKRAQPVEPVAQNMAGGAAGMGPMDITGRPAALKAPIKTVNQKLVLAGMVPHARFGQFGITSKEMWDAQIDIWLTEILIDAIVKMNADKESISEAVIRQIDVIELMGGDGQRVTKDSGSSDPMMGGMGGMDPAGMGMSGMGGGTQAPTTVVFSPEEEFGRAIDAASGDAGMGMGMMDPAGMPGGGPTVNAAKRYIAETEESPFLERGFYLSVIILQTKIPDFIVTLANSDWPVQVRRFQVGVNPYRVDQPGMNPGMMPGMGMGMEGNFSMGPSRSRPSRSGGMGGGMPGMSGMESGRGDLTNIYGGNLPEFAGAALNHPDLVQLEVCGVITLYKQPKEALAAIEARKQAEAQAAGAVPAVPASVAGQDGIAPETAPADGVPAASPAAMTPGAAPTEADLKPVVPESATAPPAAVNPAPAAPAPTSTPEPAAAAPTPAATPPAQ